MTLNLTFTPARVTALHWGHIFRVNVLKVRSFFFFYSQCKMLVIRAGIHKLLVRIGKKGRP